MRTRLRPSHSLLAPLGLMALVASIAAVAFLLYQDVSAYAIRWRGVESGLEAHQVSLEQPRFGTNIALERYTDEAQVRIALETVRSAGFGTVRQQFAWDALEPAPGEYRWDAWDPIFPLLDAYDLKVIAVLDTSPAWARPAGEQGNRWAPPADRADYVRFVRAFAKRYGGWVDAYQIWDRPNIHPHWGQGVVDPAGYVALLRDASEAIRSADPDARIIAGGLASNLEEGGRNMSDVLFLREIYRRGAGAHFDVLGVQAYGFWSGPEDRRVSEGVLNFSRVILLREEMMRRGDAAKPVWALEAGWCGLPSDWEGSPPIAGCDTPFIQGERVAGAVQRVQREWPWMGLMVLMHLQPDLPEDDPTWGYALLGPDGEPRPIYSRLDALLSDHRVLYPGVTQDPRAALVQFPDTALADLSFWGTDLLLQVASGVSQGQLSARIDEQARAVQLDLDTPKAAPGRQKVGGPVNAGLHQARLHGNPGQLDALEAVQVGYRPDVADWWLRFAAGAVLLSWLGVAAARTACQIPWAVGWRWLQGLWGRIPGWAQVAAYVAAYGVLAFSPSPLLRLLGLLAYGVASLFRPDVALCIAVAVVPLAPIHVRLGPGSFSLAEVSVLVAAGAWVWQAVLASGEGEPITVRGILRRVRWADIAVVLLVALGVLGALWAEYQRVALREVRVVFMVSALLYLLVRRGAGGQGAREPSLELLLDVLWASAVSVALYALVRYPSAGGVIEAEGVRRARAFYGSPNNLALYLDRLLPLGVAVGLWGRTRWRRVVYAVGTAPVAVALLLTFSRGAWVLGIPCGLLMVAWLRGGRVRWIVLGLLVIAALLAVPLVGTERFATLLDVSQGTTFLRVSLWQAAWDMVRDHTWLGVGPDNFLYYYGDYIRPGAEVDRWLSHPHNWVLDFWLRLGAAGVVSALLLLGAYLRNGLRLYRALPEGDRRAMALGLLGGWAAFVAHGSVDSSLFVIELACWFMVALAWVTRAVEESSRPAA